MRHRQNAQKELISEFNQSPNLKNNILWCIQWVQMDRKTNKELKNVTLTKQTKRAKKLTHGQRICRMVIYVYLSFNDAVVVAFIQRLGSAFQSIVHFCSEYILSTVKEIGGNGSDGECDAICVFEKERSLIFKLMSTVLTVDSNGR